MCIYINQMITLYIYLKFICHLYLNKAGKVKLHCKRGKKSIKYNVR